MFGTLLRKVFGSKNDRELKRIQPLINDINQRESALTHLSLDELRTQTPLFRERLTQGAPLDSLLPEAFAVVREVSRRLLNMRHFDVQLIGGVVLHEGKIAEMKTGEGKTLVATLPVYLNSLVGQGVHVVTVNDYLARRDAEWMGPVYQADRIIPRLRQESDYTIDEKMRSVALTEEGVAKAERLLAVDNLYDPMHIETLHHLTQALKAHTLFKKDVDYVVKEGEVIIVDEFTGRLMPGRRYSEGLHQALEAKEHLKVANENQTLASITFQNYFRMYSKLGGMTGTADTEATEFHTIYNLEVMVIPTNRSLIRTEYADVVYRTEREKFQAVVEEIRELHKQSRPVLVGTISIEKSELLSTMLKRQGIPHNVLNAKQHEREAEIVAQAGRKGAVTISTNMAGRGTDILLGGHPEFLARQACKLGSADPDYPVQLQRAHAQCTAEHEEVVARGGLHILGTERHEARRIDNQLRGRAGRQGDPGSSRFYLSLEDDLLRIFGSDKVKALMQRLGMEKGVGLESREVCKRN